MLSSHELLAKYNTPVPRYTSYPTVPFWHELAPDKVWQQNFKTNFLKQNSDGGISLYLHLPFCESLCTYCGCNKKITTHHSVEGEYIAALLREWHLYLGLMEERPVIRELHLGGGTPTFFSPRNIEKLMQGLLKDATVHKDHEFGIEGHPNNTTDAHLAMLYDLGFRRISFGVQDNDPVVQKAINRIQPLANVKRVTEKAREAGFLSVNYDLIYGLPFQTLSGEEKTLDETIGLRPDRIAFYSYAHVPWKSKAQRLFDENDLPSAELKTQLYLLAHQKFEAAGYFDIGMDHFALPGDDLYHAWQQGKLHRNFMGYTTTHTSFLLGLGVSSITDTGNTYGQNHKELANYLRQVGNGEFAVNRGCYLSETDLVLKNYILQTACKGGVTFRKEDDRLLQEFPLQHLRELAADGLIELDRIGFRVNEAGRQYLRNICQSFDQKWWLTAMAQTLPLFSRSV